MEINIRYLYSYHFCFTIIFHNAVRLKESIHWQNDKGVVTLPKELIVSQFNREIVMFNADITDVHLL